MSGGEPRHRAARRGRGRARAMRGEPMPGAMRRLLGVIAIILFVVIAGIIDSYLTWEATFRHWTAATNAEVVATRCTTLQSLFAAQRPLMLRYLTDPEPATLAGIREGQARFTRQAGLISPQTPAGAAALAAARSAEQTAYAAFGRAQSLVTAGRPEGSAAITSVDVRSATVTASLSTLIDRPDPRGRPSAQRPPGPVAGHLRATGRAG